jgi:hypothetical protein
MDNNFIDKDKRIIILNEDKPVDSPRLVDAYGVPIDPEEEPYIPCLDGTDPVPPRTHILGIPKEWRK